MAFVMSDGANAIDLVVVPLPSCPRELEPVHQTFPSRMMHVCSLPAAGEESAGVKASPGTFGVAAFTTGEAIVTTEAVKAMKRSRRSFIGGSSR
jgi:hypothetical protein